MAIGSSQRKRHELVAGILTLAALLLTSCGDGFDGRATTPTVSGTSGKSGTEFVDSSTSTETPNTPAPNSGRLSGSGPFECPITGPELSTLFGLELVAQSNQGEVNPSQETSCVLSNPGGALAYSAKDFWVMFGRDLGYTVEEAREFFREAAAKSASENKPVNWTIVDRPEIAQGAYSLRTNSKEFAAPGNWESESVTVPSSDGSSEWTISVFVGEDWVSSGRQATASVVQLMQYLAQS